MLEVEPMKTNHPMARRISRSLRKGLVCGAISLLVPTLAGCIDILGPSCEDCGPNPHWEYTCIGWIAPVCGTYCVSTTEDGGVQLLEDCCCGGGSSASPFGKASEEVEWRPLRYHEVDSKANGN